VLIALIIVGLLAAIAIVWMILQKSVATDAVQVPNVANKTVAEAESTLTKAGFSPQRAEEASATVPKDQVTRTSPAADALAQPHSTVTYYVSTGPATAKVPDVSGKTPEQAVTLLEAAKLKVSENRVPDDNPAFPKNQVTKTDPPASSPVQEGSAVTLYVSTGRVQVTNVVGKTQADAVAELQGLKLLPVVQTQESTTVPAGSVISTAPVAGTLLDQGKSITVLVATAPAQAVVPDGLVGLAYNDAVTRLTAAKLTTIKRVDAPSAQPPGTVVSVNPISGTTVPLTQQIVVTVSAGSTPSPSPTTTSTAPSKP
jgi:serine/threonine-protein kinase